MALSFPFLFSLKKSKTRYPSISTRRNAPLSFQQVQMLNKGEENLTVLMVINTTLNCNLVYSKWCGMVF